MNLSDILQYFETKSKIADILGISHQAVSKWGEYVPPARQYQIEVITKGAFKASPIIKKYKQQPQN